MPKPQLDDDEKPYVLDELFKKSTWIILPTYFFGALFVVNVFELPEWLMLLILMGFVYLGTNLIWLKMLNSSYIKPDAPKLNSEEPNPDRKNPDGK